MVLNALVKDNAVKRQTIVNFIYCFSFYSLCEYKNAIKKAINKKMIKLEIKLSTASSCISTEISMVTILLLLMNVNINLMIVRSTGWI